MSCWFPRHPSLASEEWVCDLRPQAMRLHTLLPVPHTTLPQESPLYESLLSCFTESEDTVTLAETEGEHEYQQIQVVRAAAKADEEEHGKNIEGEFRDKGSSRHESSDAVPEIPQRQPHKTPLTKLNTLDVRPEKYGKENESADDTSFSYQSRKEALEVFPSAKTRKNSMQSVSSHESLKSAISTLSSSSGDNASVMSGSDTTYQELSQPSTVIYVSSNGNKNSVNAASPHNSEVSGKKSSSENGGNVSENNTHHVGTQVSQSLSSSYSKNSHKSTQLSSRSGSADAATQVEMVELTQPPRTFFPPLTIELPETKSTGWKYEQNTPSKKRSTQVRHGDSPYIITTLDPPIKRPTQRHHKNNTSSPDPRPADIPPLIVNFDYEDTFSDDDTIYEMDCSWSTAGESTSLYMADSDTSSLYSSVGEIYSMFETEPDALVYVYRPPPRPKDHGHNRNSTLSYRFPTYAVSRGMGSSGGSSESESSWGSGTVSFIEPSYRPSNLSVGSRGHLKIDYSCSWNRLDDFVRTTSPKDGCYGCSEDYRMQYASRSPREHPASACMTAPAALLLPWERYSDTAAG
ncbi:uncharacterized protein LOC127006964 isoform X2 [Eriocheir sinensis]|uniref:uncharacterized protein LOC127006964 isoform X2 n=1 Tax=Eriocheir sinensis TaxID=95602 RepID=UPI0021C7D91D|nr:uncharacterized protein LOC127006964 isoform X2 [Eriocheir sinensis]XP_050733374.1 uncharacterized protein LOC127006964 isoform X2 [Eriocheir sinensis]